MTDVGTIQSIFDAIDTDCQQINPIDIHHDWLDSQSDDVYWLLCDLVLQYRMDTEAALSQLLHLDAYLMHFLGITKHQSLSQNLDRAQFALGSDDLRYVLSRLATLLSALKRVSHRASKTLFAESLLKKQDKYRDAIVKKLITNTQFVKKIHKNAQKLALTIDALPEGKKVEAMDYIASIQGPISRHHLAIQNGLNVLNGLYFKQFKARLDTKLSHILDNMNRLVNQMPLNEPTNRLFQPNVIPRDNLEKRAEEKRTLSFFH